MLTLASNERIPLAPSMRLLLEINHMKHCSPATVSRGGVIFVNAADIGWRPVSGWIDKSRIMLELRLKGWYTSKEHRCSSCFTSPTRHDCQLCMGQQCSHI